MAINKLCCLLNEENIIGSSERDACFQIILKFWEKYHKILTVSLLESKPLLTFTQFWFSFVFPHINFLPKLFSAPPPFKKSREFVLADLAFFIKTFQWNLPCSKSVPFLCFLLFLITKSCNVFIITGYTTWRIWKSLRNWPICKKNWRIFNNLMAILK